MRRTIVPALLTFGCILCGCDSRARTPEAAYAEAKNLLRSERYDAASQIADAALRRAGSGTNLQWQLRLLRVEILLGRRLADQALQVLDSYGEPPAGADWDEVRARDLLLRGQASYTLNRFAAAHTFFAGAETAVHSDGLRAEIALREGTLLALEKRFSEAHVKLNDALDAAMKLQDRYLEALTASNIGFTLHAEARYEEAIPWYERSRALTLGLGANDSAARADGNLGACYASLGDYPNAQVHYDGAQASFARSGDRFDQQVFLGNSGNVLRFAGDYAAASAAYAKALAIAREIPSPVWEARWLNNLATDAINLEDWNAAERYNNESLAMKRKLGSLGFEPTWTMNAADIAAGRGHFDEATGRYRQVLGTPDGAAFFVAAHAGIAGSYAMKGQPREAEAEFQAAIAEIDRRGTNLTGVESRLSFLSSLNFVFHRYIDFLVANHQTERALEVMEASRSRVLEQGRATARTAPKSVKDYESIARATGATLAEFSLGEKQSYLWVVEPGGVSFHVLPARDALRPLITGYSAVVMGGRNPLDVADQTGVRLFDALVAPLVEDAARANRSARFLIVPDDDLYSFNFETLPAGRDTSKFWIEDATVSIAPSLNFLAAGKRAAEGSSKMLLVGDPVPSMAQYPRLEFADREIRSIAAALPDSMATVLEAERARPDTYEAAGPAQFGFIHFSAHASANQINPLDSAIILSGPPDRCRLTARDVVARPLNARLVTVSACRSVGGRAYAGEGLVGFAWAFLRAGAGNVIAGLWDVNDRSTMQLMSRLYKEIGAGEPIADALRTARLELIHEGGAYAKPFYWAPFQLYTGSIEAISPRRRM